MSTTNTITITTDSNTYNNTKIRLSDIKQKIDYKDTKKYEDKKYEDVYTQTSNFDDSIYLRGQLGQGC